MTPVAETVRCHCARPADFALRRWPDGVVVYDDACASWQMLNPIAGEAFEQVLSQGTQGVDAVGLARALVQGDPTPEEVDQVAGLLAEFESMGLVECLRRTA